MKSNIVLIFVFILFVSILGETQTPIPSTCRQLILVITDSVTATNGQLYLFEKNTSDSDWIQSQHIIPVSLGRNGLGYGLGLHDPKILQNLPQKREGDGRSPAGIFFLSSIFGYKPSHQMAHISMPYIQITEKIECIDDTNSDHYNQIVPNSKGTIDWSSSEKMSRAGIYYEQGVVVDHNTNPIKKSSGSCIFLHNWAKPFETTAGCTVMSPEKMSSVIQWLEDVKKPILVQLTKQLYFKLNNSWKLPVILNQ